MHLRKMLVEFANKKKVHLLKKSRITYGRCILSSYLFGHHSRNGVQNDRDQDCCWCFNTASFIAVIGASKLSRNLNTPLPLTIQFAPACATM